MGLLTIKVAEHLHTTRWLEKVFYKKFTNVKKVPISKFVKLRTAARLLQSTEEDLRATIEASKVLHAVQVNDSFLVHPTKLWGMIKSKMRRIVKSAIS